MVRRGEACACAGLAARNHPAVAVVVFVLLLLLLLLLLLALQLRQPPPIMQRDAHPALANRHLKPLRGARPTRPSSAAPRRRHSPSS